jgi:pentatricopeptide repeat protein
MEELWELRRYVEAGDVDAALALLDEMEGMSHDDKITRIRSYMKVLLTHLIKQAVEKRTNRSWDVSIRNALDEIATHNKRRKAGAWYLTHDELVETLREAYELALDRAALEAFGGAYAPADVRAMHDPAALLQEAMQLIDQTQESMRRPA